MDKEKIIHDILSITNNYNVDELNKLEEYTLIEIYESIITPPLEDIGE